MKKTCPILVVLLLLAAPAAVRAQFTYTTNNGAITLTNYSGSGGAVTISNFVTSIGNDAFYDCTNLASVTIPTSVTNIGDSTFYDCTNLTNVTIPTSVTSIGDEAFYDCRSLTSVTIPASVTSIGWYAFENCTSLTGVTIPNGVTTIGEYAFIGCSGLTNVMIPNSVTNIGDQAFSYCSSLTAITVDSQNSFYSSTNGVLFDKSQTALIAYPGGIGGSYTIPATVTNIGDSAFHGCSALTSVTIPRTVAIIGGSAFYYCSSLTNVTIGTNVAIIGDSAFFACLNLTNVTIPGRVTYIGSYAFYLCANLTSVTIPASVSNIGDHAFAACYSLSAITVAANNSYYRSVNGVLFDESQTTLVEYPGGVGGSYTIPGTVINVGDGAFEYCSLSGVTIGTYVTIIGDSAFFGCSGLTNVMIPNSVTNIGDQAFYVCTRLTNVSIGNRVSSIGDDAFGYCTSLTGAYFHGNAPSGDATVFADDSQVTVYYLPGTSAWTSTFGGAPAVMLNPPAQAGRLQVTISPARAVTEGAQWQADDGILQPGGATVLGLAVGNHTLSFTTIAGWETPPIQKVAISNGATTTATGLYTPKEKPVLTITSPKSGQSVSNALLLLKGTVSDKVAVDAVYYQLNINRWMLATPSNSWSNWTASVTLNPGSNTISAYAVDANGAFSATNTNHVVYVVTGDLQVTLTPSAATNLGAQWRVDAGAFHDSGVTVSNLLVGNHALSFKSVSGFATPSNQAVSIASNQVTLATGAYLDTNRPTLTIVSPTPNLRLSNTVFTVTGKAADNVAVSTVLYQLNYRGWSDAGSTNHWTNWTASITPAPGSNTLQACALDTSANYSLTNTVHFTYIPSATLTVKTNGLGSITPIDNGKLLAIGTNYTLKAALVNNWLLSNWVGGTSAPLAVLTNSPTLTFAMLSNLVLEANFVTNPFPAIAGSFNGLFYQTNGSPVTEQSSGFATITIASTSKGAYTAKLLLDGGSYSFTGAFDLNGNSVTNLARKGKSPLALTLHVDLNTFPPATVMTGAVAATNWAGPSGLIADLAVFNGKTIVASNYAGKYTLVLPGSATPSTSPGGYGAATFTNNLAGTAVVGGALGDGTPLGSQSVPISQDGLVPVYVPLYSGQGSVFGWLAFSNLPPKTVSGGLTWFKLSGPAKSLYSNGFTFQTNIIGSVYVPSTTNILALTNGTLTITDPGQGIDLIYTNVTVISNKLTYTAPPTNQLIVTFTPASGTVTVSFRPTGAKANITAQGVVLQGALADPSLKAAGWFTGTNQSGTFELEAR
jgi:hypothetical protein